MQERLTKGEDFFLQQISLLISHLNTTVSRCAIVETNCREINAQIQRIEEKIDIITHLISQKTTDEVK